MGWLSCGMDGKRWCSIWKLRYDIHQLTKPNGPVAIIATAAATAERRTEIALRGVVWLVGATAGAPAVIFNNHSKYVYGLHQSHAAEIKKRGGREGKRARGTERVCVRARARVCVHW